MGAGQHQLAGTAARRRIAPKWPARLLGSRRGAPPFIGYNGTYPGYLGAVYKPYRPQGGDLRLSKAMTAERMQSRSELLSSLDCLKREADNSGQMVALDS